MRSGIVLPVNHRMNFLNITYILNITKTKKDEQNKKSGYQKSNCSA